ncbi:MAG: 4a-hydroxytetrahydrobiopterin dehydratase [Exilibacterium sp.]
MQELTGLICEACRADAPRVSAEELTEYCRQIPKWALRQEQGVDQLRREFSFKDFRQALAFTQMVGELAESHGHHPALVTEWEQNYRETLCAN